MHDPTILAIDTATEVCAVALLRGGVLIERSETVGQSHSEHILPMVDAVLAAGGLALGVVDAYAFGAGPGSFTGLRIACGVTQGLAYGCARPVVPIGNLRALAAVALADCLPGERVLAAIDARMHEAYCAIYVNDQAISELRPPALAAPAQLPTLARSAGVQCVAGDALSAFPEVWSDADPWRRFPDCRGSVAAIARLARFDLSRGAGIAAADATPIYVRDEVALTIEQRRERTAAAARGAAGAQR